MADRIPKEMLLMVMKKRLAKPDVEVIGDYPNDDSPITDLTREERDITNEKKRRFDSLQKMIGSSGKKFSSSNDDDDEYSVLR